MNDPFQVATEAASLIRAGQFDRALSLLEPALGRWPGHGYLLAARAAACHRSGRLEHAAEAATEALRDTDVDAGVLFQMGCLLGELGRMPEGAALLHAQAARRRDDYAVAVTLANVLMQAEWFESAAAEIGSLVSQLGPRPDLARMQGISLLECGRTAEAIDLYQTIADGPAGEPQDLTRLASAMNYLPGVEAMRVLQPHLEYGRMLGDPAAAHAAKATPTRRSIGARPARIGIVSSDLRRHSVAAFIRPVLARLDRRRFAVHCYALGCNDGVTESLRPLADAWADLAPYDYAGLRRAASADQLDLLIELNGHTGGCVLPALTPRLAPVQATYLGYPNTTGLGSIDYRLVDAHTDPAGAEARATEKLVRMDGCFVCYTAPANLPAVAARPAGEPMTFGSFNALAKINDPVLECWAAVLRAVPGSRLVLKCAGLGDPLTQPRLSRRLVALGIEPARVQMLGRLADDGDHLSMYGRVDVSLDTFPYSGATTTCESLVMGVPVVTMAGSMHAGRVGVSLLNAVGGGLAGLIARDRDEYISIATDLAGDHSRLSALRAGRRQRVLASPLCDADAFSRRFERALSHMLALD